jgi:transposase
LENHIIFTDEAWFILTDEGALVWKRFAEEPIMHPKMKHPQKIMIWAGVWWDGVTKICFIGKKVNRWYQEILNEYLIKPSVHVEHEILQDGAKPHTAEATWEFIDDSGIEMRQNPPYSPELNPIEKVWGWLKGKLNQHCSQNLDELKQLIEQYWENFAQTAIRKWIAHNKPVVNQIVMAGGGIISVNRHPKKHKR